MGKKKSRFPLTVVDAFAGAGGLSAGFSSATVPGSKSSQKGFVSVFAVDRDRSATNTYRKNHFPDVPLDQDDPRVHCGDIDEVNADRILAVVAPRKSIDVLIGGPSCQGVSSVGLRNPSDPRNKMLLAFVRLVKELRPKWFVMENVPGLTHSNNRALLAEVLGMFEGISGYTVSGDVLLAAGYGVPQLRYRLFIVGNRVGAPILFPPAKHGVDKIGSKLQGKLLPYKTVSDAIFTLRRIPAIETNPKGKVKAVPAVANHYYRGITDINRRRIESIDAGKDWRSMPIKLLPERYFATRASDQKGAYGRLSWNWPAYTVTNSALNISAGAFTHPEHHRCLSVREVARLQSFPDSYEFCGSVEAQYRQVGNAVPPLLAQAVAEMILLCESNPKLAKSRGIHGRLNAKLVRDSLSDEDIFPVLTPRLPQPSNDRESFKRLGKKIAAVSVPKPASAWTQKPRPENPWPDELEKLRNLSAQPQNLRAAKRARCIVNFLDGMTKPDILRSANASEASVKKWIDGYFEKGIDGWRAYHSEFDRIAENDKRLNERIQQSITRARKLLLKPSKSSGDAPLAKRLHMNAYIRKLISTHGDKSVAALKLDVQRAIGNKLGTVYVGDLLAIADAVLSDSDTFMPEVREAA